MFIRLKIHFALKNVKKRRQKRKRKNEAFAVRPKLFDCFKGHRRPFFDVLRIFDTKPT